MSIGTLSPRVTLEQARNHAKELVKAFRARDHDALDRIRWNHPRFRGLTDAQIRRRKFALADAQLVIARLHYFESWPKLLQHIDALQTRDLHVMRFEAAADAIITGADVKLDALLRAAPELVQQRSTRGHRAPLLHYVTANGVEDYRQVSPGNAVEVAKVLLEAGAKVDMTSEAYGGGWTALGLVATSTPPRRSGVQISLIDVLLEYGAAIDGLEPGANTVMGALGNGCPEAAVALVERGARVDSIVAAAGVGRLDLLERLAASSTKEQLEKALIMAARYGRYAALEYLLVKGADVAASDGMTALHHAAGRADLDMMELLIRRGAPLEKQNVHGATVLENAVWFARHVASGELERRDYPTVIDMLIAAGARTDVYPGMQTHINEVCLARRKEGA